MSNYFQVLKRIEQDRNLRLAAAEAAAAPQHDIETHDEAPATPPEPTPAAAPSVATPAASASAAAPTATTAPSAAAAAPAATTTHASAHAAPAPARPLPTPTAPARPAPTPPTAPSAPTAAPPPARPLRAVPSPPPTSHSAPAPTPTPPPSAPIELRPPVRPPTPPLSAEGQRGIATLFDNIRALASGRSTRVLVFAGASATDSMYAVTEGLARHAQRQGMRAFIAELTRGDGGPTLVSRMSSPPEPLAIDLDGGAAPGELNAWVSAAAGTSDLVLLEAPPLADSIDAALLACACDGLVIVADFEVTDRGALQVAAERALVAGCRTLGVVMNGTRERLPSWMRRIFGQSGGV